MTDICSRVNPHLQQKYLRHLGFFSLLTMHLHWLILFLVSLGWVSEAENCNATEYVKAKKDLFEHLDLYKNVSENPRMWPLIFSDDNSDIYPVNINVDLYVTSIIAVNEKAQSLTTQMKMKTVWPNSNMNWNITEFCGIKTFVVPKTMFWTPDIGIIQSIKTEFGTKESPNVLLLSQGYTTSSDVLALTTTCKMDLHRFPFDIQSCSITLQSTAYSIKEVRIYALTETQRVYIKSKEIFQSQGEWELLSIDSYKATTNDSLDWFEMDQLVYEITIKRRPLLYVINIIVPVLFFLVLDVTSFFIDTSGADKLSFKVTLLLSISVLLLILNDTLPSTSERIPLIGVYCCGIFCLIGISIMETIFVNYLMVKGAQKRSVETTATVSERDDSVKDQNEEQSSTLEHLKQILILCRAATQQNQREKTSRYLTRMARIIDKTFLVLYIITIIVFLSVIGRRWIP